MDRGTVRYASEKIASVRGPRRTSAPVPYVEGKYKPKELHRIIGGLLTMDSGWRPPLGESFENALAGFGGDGALDIGCSLRDGAFEVHGEDVSLTRSETDSPLIFFAVRLLMRLQSMASPPAIEFDEYGRALKRVTR
ncbi:MAG: hypothetical protein LC808_00220 [Actinobacteria bacterium]|nr:hypothetical protein [Actinomycetota bacterium]